MITLTNLKLGKEMIIQQVVYNLYLKKYYKIIGINLSKQKNYILTRKQ